MTSRLSAWGVAGGLMAATFAHGQGISGVDARESARFAAVVRAASGAGYANPVVVAHGSGDMDALFVLLAGRDGKGVLLAASDGAGGAGRPVELEHGENPAALGIRGVEFGAFLGASDVYDIVVRHTPFMLETSSEFQTHHILRRRGAVLEAACEFPGGSSSSTSKGIGSIVGTRRVTVDRGPGGFPGAFVVKTTDETTEQDRGQVPRVTAHTETTVVFDLPSSGVCKARPPGQ